MPCSRSAPAGATRPRSWRSLQTGSGLSRLSRSSPAWPEARLQQLGYSRVGIRVGDGSRGWAEHAPYDKILVTAAAERAPPALLEQLEPGGRMVMPVGGEEQQLTVIDKDETGGTRAREVMSVRFSRLETVM